MRKQFRTDSADYLHGLQLHKAIISCYQSNGMFLLTSSLAKIKPFDEKRSYICSRRGQHSQTLTFKELRYEELNGKKSFSTLEHFTHFHYQLKKRQVIQLVNLICLHIFLLFLISVYGRPVILIDLWKKATFLSTDRIK